MLNASPEPKPSLLAWAAKHPFQVALLCGSIMAGWTTMIYHDWRQSLVSGAIVFAIVFVLWIPGGPARRRMEK